MDRFEKERPDLCSRLTYIFKAQQRFYQMLAAVGRAKPGQLRRAARERLRQADPKKKWTDRFGIECFSVVPLFREPEAERGQLVTLQGTARRVRRIPVGNPDIVERFGIDHYFNIYMFTEDGGDNPIAWKRVVDQYLILHEFRLEVLRKTKATKLVIERDFDEERNLWPNADPRAPYTDAILLTDSNSDDYPNANSYEYTDGDFYEYANADSDTITYANCYCHLDQHEHGDGSGVEWSAENGPGGALVRGLLATKSI